MNELLGWYGYDNEERMEITSKINNITNRNSKKIANISQKLMETKQNISNNCNSSNNNSINLSVTHKLAQQLNDCSSMSSDKDSSRENSKSPMVLKSSEKKGEQFNGFYSRTIPFSQPH